MTIIEKMANETPTIDILVNLESYSQSHISASSSLKTAIWDLNKARRQRRRNMMGYGHAFSALDVREELRAQTKVECLNEEPSLVDDDSDENVVNDHGDSFILCTVDVTNTTKDNVKESNDDNDGMRHRKSERSKPNTDQKQSKWTEEIIIDEEEMKLRNTNPLDLFGGGLTPRDLKLAQKHAKESLASYITAANDVAKILKAMQGLKANIDVSDDKEEEEQ
jgi:hypothetical protein